MYIAIDIGGTNLRAASFLSLDNPQIKDFKSEKTSQNYDSSLRLIRNLVNEVSAGAHVEKVGVGAPGAANLPDWRNKDLKSDLHALLGCPIFVENDAAAAALGEAYYGSGKIQDFLFITMGTGVGGAFIRYINGIPHVTPAELGHQIVVSNGLICACGQHGCVEAYYRQNSQDMIAYLVQGIINCLTINPVDFVFLAGGAAVNKPDMVLQIKQGVKKSLKILPPPKIQLATHKELAGIYGALSLIKSTV